LPFCIFSAANNCLSRKVVKKENRQFLRTAGGQVEVTIIVIAAVYPKPADEAFPIRPGVDIKLEIKTFAWRTGNVVSGNIHIGVDQSKLIGPDGLHQTEFATNCVTLALDAAIGAMIGPVPGAPAPTV